MTADQGPVAPAALVLPADVAELRLIGWTHRTSTLRVLEQVAVPRTSRPGLLQRLRDSGHSEVVVLSTCSRTEAYVRCPPGAPQDSSAALVGAAHLPSRDLDPPLARSGAAVVSHLFRVTAGLDSRVVGEAEIREQVRSALRDALATGCAGPSLTRLFAAALRSAARVQQQTGLGAQGRSLGHRAVDLGMARIDASGTPFVLVVGAGRMARAAVEHLSRHGVKAHVAARDTGQAARLVGSRRVCPIIALQAGIEHADLIICATSASSFVVTAPNVRRAMQSRSTPLTVVDLSVPRNVDAAVADVPGVRLVDLSQMHDDAGSDPVFVQSVQHAQQLVLLEQQRYLADAGARGAAPVISEMRRRVEQLCADELTRKGRPVLDEVQAAAMARSLAGKLLHGPVLAAREAARHGDDALLQQLASLFPPSTAGRGALPSVPVAAGPER